MSDKNEARPFGARDKWGYLFGDFGNDFTFIFALRSLHGAMVHAFLQVPAEYR